MTRVHRRGLKTEIAIFCCDFPDYWKSEIINRKIIILTFIFITLSNTVVCFCEFLSTLFLGCNLHHAADREPMIYLLDNLLIVLCTWQ